MATFSADVYQNEFLPDGGTDVHAIVTVACSGAGEAGQSGSGDAAEIVIVDTSGSMSGENIAAVQVAASAALDQVLDGVWFAVVAGSHQAWLAYPQDGRSAMVQMNATTRAQAKAAVAGFRAEGGTAMGTWLTLATRLFAAVPSATQRHAILLTDGYNQHETPEQLSAAIEAARGRFQCDCRGVGSAWQVAEVRRIATALLGSVDLIAQPAGDGGRLRADHAPVDGPRGRRARRCGCGRRRAPRCCSCARCRRPSRTSRPGARRSTR